MTGEHSSEDAARFRRVISIFEDVRTLEGDARAAALDRLCDGDASVRAEVEGMLLHDSVGASLFDAVEEGRALEAIAGDLIADVGDDLASTQIEGYTLLREVGRGGMGVIFEARQSAPSRRVAIKVLRPGMGFGDVVRRFERESHVLAQLHHPGIAQIYEAGVAECAGGRRPFFSMEFVAGLPLDRYIQERGLDTRRRLELLARVCEAVGYANDRGIVHRDLKPGNVLVVGPADGETATGVHDEVGTPKVLDFGIARVTDPTFETTTIETIAGQIIGTLAYMSPEQLSGSTDPLDARCDVYALGVIGYELLTGVRAHQIHGLTVPEAARVVRDDDPAPLTAHDRSLAGDVATIIAKAMEKDRERRYASAGELAADLRRHLTNVPIVARPASAFYKFSRFAKRNGGLVAGIASTIVVLVLGVIGTGAGLLAALDANTELGETNNELRETNENLVRVSAFQAARLSDAEPSVMGARLRSLLLDSIPEDRREAVEMELASTSFTDLARESFEANVLVGARQAIDDEFNDDPLLRARLLQSLAETRRQLGLFASAETAQRDALELRRAELGGDHPDVIHSVRARSELRRAQGDYNAAVEDARAVLEWRRARLGDEHESTVGAMNWLSATLMLTDALEESYETAIAARTLGEAHLGADHPATLEAIALAGAVMLTVERSAEAHELLSDAASRMTATRGPDDPTTLTVLTDLASAKTNLAAFDEAEEILLRVIGVHDRTLGAAHPTTLGARNTLAVLYEASSRFSEAVGVYRIIYEQRREVLGDRHPLTLVTANNYAASLEGTGELAAAEQLHRDTLAAYRATKGDRHRHTLVSVSNLGYVINAQGRTEEAEPYYREAAEGMRELEGDDSPYTLQAIQNYGVVLVGLGRVEEAVPLYEESLEGRRRVLGEENPMTLNAIYNMGEMLHEQGKLDEAEPYCEQALELYRRVLGEQHIGTLFSSATLAELRRDQGRPDEALELFRVAYDGFMVAYGPKHPTTRGTGNLLADCLEQIGQADEAAGLRAELEAVAAD